MNKRAISLLFFSSWAATMLAEPITFDFKDPKGVNTAVFKLDAPLEAVSGSASGISGKVVFDPENPASLKGTIVVQAASLHVGNPMQQQHLLSDQWMDVAKHPEITFETDAVKNVKTSGDVTTAEVTGRMTIKGITKSITAPVKITYLKDKLKARIPGKEGDLLVLRANFSIHRRDFGLHPGQMEDKVSDEIELSLSVAGAAPRGT
jgi:polyisoprenoid-binding protein YceI